MGKGEIARHKQFLLFPHCFQKARFPGRQKVSLCGNGLNMGYFFFIDCKTSSYNLYYSLWNLLPGNYLYTFTSTPTESVGQRSAPMLTPSSRNRTQNPMTERLMLYLPQPWIPQFYTIVTCLLQYQCVESHVLTLYPPREVD